ncbi:unnamed protein product [Adineta ricciae]|uniref:Uncharacterized protein n=1 Tax=Adineta ricciae TaxID=249248 RepID=A0A815W8Q7_ADIRI|nr:unnamed protein product [Adineta ricciae]
MIRRSKKTGKKRGKTSIPLDELINAVTRLGDKSSKLDDDKQWRSINSLWSRLATDLSARLSIKNDLRVRKYIYTAWSRESSNLRSHFIKQPKKPSSKPKRNGLEQLSPISSLTKTRTRPKAADSSGTNIDNNKSQQHLIEFSSDEWSNIYKKDIKSLSHNMDPSWTDVFYDKLKDAHLTKCCIVFTDSSLRKLYSRKHNSPLFHCVGQCSNSTCSLIVKMKLLNIISPGQSVVFRVEIIGTPRHENPFECNQRPLAGIKRARMAKKAKEEGILVTYEKNLLNADDELLKFNNYTDVPTTHVLATAVKEQSDAKHLDKDIFVDLEMLLFSMRETDKTSHIQNKGYIQVLQLWPFATIFYTEAQLLQYVDYCSSTKYSTIHIDATGSVVKGIPKQRKPYLYLICFKDGQGACNLLPLAGALLTDHSATSIGNWLSIVRRGIATVKKGRFVRPSYIVIDFSPALLNAILLTFDHTNIQSYLQWCFNALHKKYTSDQLNLMSCIRFCCAHVMNAFARSLSKIKFNKGIRRKVMKLFGVLINCNELAQCYELIGCIVLIFGSPDYVTAEELLDEVLQASASFLSELEEFFENKDVSKTEELMEQELAELDDVFLSSQPILHQSPFTKLARERSPILSQLMDESKKNKEKTIKNPLFSEALIKTLYKWIAYLPIFTGLMHKFQERYASDTTIETMPKLLSGGRMSNAPIESFFKILKHSILRHRTNLRPGEFLLELYSTTNARLKANQFNIQQTGSKKRGRRKKQQPDQVDPTLSVEQWKKQGTEIASRSTYFSKYVEQKLVPSDIRSRLREKLQMRKDRWDDIYDLQNLTDILAIDPQHDGSASKNNENAVAKDISKTIEEEEVPEPIQHVEISEHCETYEELSSNTNALLPVNSHEIDNINSAAPNCQSNRQETFDNVCETNADEKNVPEHKSAQTTSQKTRHVNKNDKQIIEFRLPKKWPTHTAIGNLQLRFPHFNIGPTFINATDRYSVSNTCSLDSSLFLLYYIYMSHSEDFRSAFDRDITGCRNLRNVFDLVERNGWDFARLHWLTMNEVYPKPVAKCAHIDVYGTADTNVFQFLREMQKYVIESTCICPDCPKLVRQSHSVDISLPRLTGRNRRIINLPSFSERSTTNCGATIGPNEPTSYSGSYSRDDFFPSKDGNGVTTMFICDSKRIAEPSRFVYKPPPIVLLNVGQSVINTDKNQTVETLVKDLPYVIIIGKQRYNLAGAICPRADHFTASIVYAKGRFAKYDDLYKFGVKHNEGGNDAVETAVYAIEMKNVDDD